MVRIAFSSPQFVLIQPRSSANCSFVMPASRIKDRKVPLANSR
jgi:hypothetical protein